MNTFLLAAAILTFITWGIHTFSGTKTIAVPLLESDMESVPRYTNYYCWHGITVLLAAMAGGYLYAALVPAGQDVAAFITAISIAFCLLGILIIIQKKMTTMQMPQWLLFAIISAVAVPGLF